MEQLIQRKNKFVTLRNSRFKLAIDFKKGGRKYFPSKDYVTYKNLIDEMEGLLNLIKYLDKTDGLWDKAVIYMADNLPNDFGAVPSERPNYNIKIHERNANGLYWTSNKIQFQNLENKNVKCIFAKR